MNQAVLSCPIHGTSAPRFTWSISSFDALATTSAGLAPSRGKPDGGVSLDEMLRHVREIAAATTLPVNAYFLERIRR